MTSHFRQFLVHLFKSSPKSFRALVISTFCMVLSVTTASAGTAYPHGTAGFSIEGPAQWTPHKTASGLELSKGTALLSIENLGMTSGETAEVMELFIPGSPGRKIEKPYPGLRSSLREDGYVAEVAVLRTPFGFYLISLEQAAPDAGDQQVFENALSSFSAFPAESSGDEVATQQTQPMHYDKIVEAVSEQFFLDAEAVNRLYKKKPGLFKNFITTLKEIDALDSMLAASAEKLAAQTSWKEQTSQPNELRNLFTALRSYKVSMAMLPKGFQTISLPQDVLRQYTDRRAGQSPVQAFNTLLESKIVLEERDKVYSQLLAEKKKASDAVTGDMSKYLKGKADLYWRNRLEANYLLTLIKSQKEALINELWGQSASDLELIRNNIRP